MSKQAHILAVKSNLLSLQLMASYPVPNGFIAMSEDDALSTLENAQLFIGPRPLLEETDAFRQVIPYVILRKGDRYVTYTRGASGNEARLHGKLTFGLGGHIDLPDIEAKEDGSIHLHETLQLAAQRELMEEVVIGDHDSGLTKLASFCLDWKGLLLDNSDAVGRVHVGIVGMLDIAEKVDVTAGEDSQEDIQWLTLDELAAQRDRLEGWTRIIVDAMRVPA